MKYGEALQKESDPKWAPYNVDYNELKNLIKVHTKRDDGQAIAIPGQTNTALAEFEEAFFNELYNQHDRVDLWVHSKSFEIEERLKSHEKQVLRLIQRSTFSNGNPLTQSQREKFGKYDRQITTCGEDLKSLQRFVDAQRTAFRKILKKYRKWTGSRTLDERFNREVLGSPKSFVHRDFEPLIRRQKIILANLRQSTPDSSVPTTPRPQSRRPSAPIQVQQVQQSYWNEYDDGSEAGGDEPYTIYVDPDTSSGFPGAKAMANIFSDSMEKVKGWLSPRHPPGEREPLLERPNGRGNSSPGYFNNQTDTDDVDDEAYASSSDFPNGYATHYSTFPSVGDQRSAREREKLLFRCTIASFVTAFILLLIASILVATGKHKLRVEVDAGAIIGVVASIMFAALGIGMTMYTTEQLTLLHRSCVCVTFLTLCFLNLMLLLLVVGNGGL